MKSTYYQSILAVAAIGVFYTNLPQYLFEAQGFVDFEAPKHWILAFCLLSLPVLIKRGTVSNVLKSPAFVWCFGYALLAVIWFLLSAQSDLMWQEVRWRFMAIIVILTGLIVFWQPDAIRLARKTLVAMVLLGVALNVYEVFVPMSFSQSLGRSAGLYQNPNTSGEALVLGMILSVTVLAPRYRGPFMLLTGIGVLVTISRASILAWVIATAGFILVNRVPLKPLLQSGFVGLILTVLALLPRWDQVLTTWDRNGVMNKDVLERLAWFTDPSGVSDKSSWERKYVAKLAWEKVAEHPFLGRGTGSFHESYVLPHNLYLALMLDHGIIGAMIVPLLILAVTWGARGESKHLTVIFGCAFLVLSAFTHAILSYEYSLLLVSLVAAMAGTSRSRTGTVSADGIHASWQLSLGRAFSK